MLKVSTIQLLRFPFSFFLMPVFWFALSLQSTIYWPTVLLLFVVLHLLVYPSSNGYNSYMDRDETSIGGIEKPPPPEKELWMVTIVMDVLAILLASFISFTVAGLLLVYIIFSRLYSYRCVRLKKYPIIGYLTVVLNQGLLVFVMVSFAAGNNPFTAQLLLPCIAAAFLIGGFYPITQIYQHESDTADGVKTISILLGKKGTFIFCGLIYSAAFGLLFAYFSKLNQQGLFFLLQIFFLPVIVYFIVWSIMVWKDEKNANFKHTMQMNWLASFCSNAAFITILIVQQIG